MPFRTTLSNKLGVPVIDVGKFNVWKYITRSNQKSNIFLSLQNVDSHVKKTNFSLPFGNVVDQNVQQFDRLTEFRS